MRARTRNGSISKVTTEKAFYGDLLRMKSRNCGILLGIAILVLAACTPGPLATPIQTPSETPVSPTNTAPAPSPIPTLHPVGPCPVPEGTPSPLDLSTTGDVESNLLAYLNAGGSVTDLGRHLESVGLLSTSGLGPVQLDLTGDGLDDLALTVVDRASQGPFPAGTFFLFACSGGRYESTYTSPSSPEGGVPVIHAAQDLTGDGLADLLIGRPVCGAHTCFETAQVLVWSGSTLENRFTGDSSDLPNPLFEVLGPISSGSYQIAITGTGIGSVGAGPYRRITRTWSVDPLTQTFTISAEVQQPSNYRIHMLQDADRAARQGNYPSALDLYYRVVTDESLDDWVDPMSERANLAAYATFRHLVTHLQMGDSGDAQVIYGILQNGYPPGAVGHPYAEMATAFWTEYQRHENVATACAAAQAFAAAHASDVIDPLYFGYANQTYNASDICPVEP